MTWNAQMLALVSAAVLCAAGDATAQDTWPKARNVRWLIGVPPGGNIDPITRYVAERLAPRIGATFVIENKPGANQAIAARDLTRSDPDGYTLMSVAGPTLYSRPEPEIGNGIDPVAALSRGPMILAGTTKRDTPTLKALIADAKANPDQWSYAVVGIASIQNIGGEFLNSLAGTRMKPVPHRGGGDAINNAIGGHVPLVMIGIGPAMANVLSGTLRGYGVTARERFPLLPAVSTMAEAGGFDIELTQNFGVNVRSGTSRPIIERLNREINAVLAQEDAKAFILKQGAIAQIMTPEQWGEFYTTQKVYVTGLAKRLGIHVME